MNKSDKIELLKTQLIDLKNFKSNLSDESLIDFNKLKERISDLLDENEKIRFNQIEFYNNTPIITEYESDDLPF